MPDMADQQKFGLTEAQAAVRTTFLGKHGIHGVRGADRIVIDTSKPLTERLINDISSVGGGFYVVVVEKPEPVKKVEPSDPSSIPQGPTLVG